MPHLRVCLVAFLTLFSGIALAEWKEGRGFTAPLTIYTQFDEQYSPVAFAALQLELSKLLIPVGLDLDWRDLKSATGRDVVVELVIVSFTGKCEMEDVVLRPDVHDSRLGWTHVSDGEVLPFSDVDCDHIRRLISPQVTVARHEERNRILGRALARVVAHEFYHIFANTRKHAGAGIARSHYSPAQLVDDSFEFEARDIQVLRAGRLRHLFHQPSPFTAGLSSGQ